MDNTIEFLTAQPYKLKEEILDGTFTKATHFLLPGLHLSKLENFHKFFVNAFLEDEELTHIIKNPVFVLCRTKVFNDVWKRFESNIKAYPRCMYEYNIGKWEDDYLIMFLFEFPIAYRSDYFKFCEGEYSQFSENYKKLFVPTITNEKGQEIENSLYGIIYKTPTFKKKLENLIDEKINPEKEYWEKWKPEREIFRKNEKET